MGFWGFNNYKYNFEKFNYSDELKIFTIIKMIKECTIEIKKEKIRKRLISKDAPASVFQHLVLNFGWKDEEMLKKVNLLSDEWWYDVYALFINEWKEKIRKDSTIEKKLLEKILEFFNRITLKKTVMTSNYGVGYESAELYFKEIVYLIENDRIEETKEFLEKNWKIVQKVFNNFFEFISDLAVLRHSPKEIINYIAQNKGIILLKDAEIDVNYYKKEKYTIDIQNEGKRYTKTFFGITNEEDHEKFETATRANFIHSLDAALTRWVIQKYGIYTIHDCFLIDAANITFLISLINEGMNVKFHDFHKTWQKEEKKIFSLFIVI